MSTTAPSLRELSTPLWHRQLAQDVDNISSQACGVSSLVLMERAGEALAKYAMSHVFAWDEAVVLAGPGNNGGDGLVCARLLKAAGRSVRVFLVAENDARLSDGFKAQRDSALQAGITLTPFEDGALQKLPAKTPLVVDAVFGIGFRGSLPSSLQKALSEANSLTNALVLAVDLPSGLDVDSGESREAPLRADETLTFGASKPGLVIRPAADLCGKVTVADTIFPKEAVEKATSRAKPGFALVNDKALLSFDPWASLPESAHKFDRGHVLVIGGSPGKTGAPILSALSALRCGAGWSSVAMPDDAFRTLKTSVPPEITFETLFDGGSLDSERLSRFLEERRVKAVCVGPGTVTQVLSESALKVLLAFTRKGGFVVLDAAATAQAATLLAGKAEDAARWVLTPHPGEWQKLGAAIKGPLSVGALDDVRALSARLGATLMHKGATPVIVGPSEREPAYVVASGSKILAKAGSGDVLAGALAAHGAMACDAPLAAARAQTLVAFAAKNAARARGENAVIASDIIERLGL